MPAPVANGRSAALARQRDHVESDQRNPYIWPRDSTGLGRREPIVLVSSHCVECPPNIFRGVRLVGRPMLVAKQFREYSLFKPGMKVQINTPLILRFMKFLHFIHDLEC